MDFKILKISACLIAMFSFIVMALTSNNIIYNQLFTAIGILTGVLTIKLLSTQNQLKNEK
jgi:hypothetical protein